MAASAGPVTYEYTGNLFWARVNSSYSLVLTSVTANISFASAIAPNTTVTGADALHWDFEGAGFSANDVISAEYSALISDPATAYAALYTGQYLDGAFSLTTDSSGNIRYWSLSAQANLVTLISSSLVLDSAGYSDPEGSTLGIRNKPGIWTVVAGTTGTSSSPEPGTVWTLAGGSVFIGWIVMIRRKWERESDREGSA